MAPAKGTHVNWEWLGWWIALSVFWSMVVQAVAAFAGGPLPWWAAAALGLVLGFLGTVALAIGYKQLSESGAE
jgi:hypothetical protein